MSVLNRFMHTARAILDERKLVDAAPKEQPPVFIRTTWIYSEIDVSIERATTLSHQIKIARLGANMDEAVRLTNDLTRTARQIAEMSRWANEQFQREVSK